MKIRFLHCRPAGWIYFACAFAALAQTPPSADPGPLPINIPSTNGANQIIHAPPPPLTAPTAIIAPAPAPNQEIPDTILAFDALAKTFNATKGESSATFVFWVTNISPNEVQITDVHSSCFCTAAKLPVVPWPLAPGASGPISATMDLKGRGPADYTKAVTITSSAGIKNLMVTSHVAPNLAAMDASERQKNMDMSRADHQAVFRGECVKCHVEPTVGKMGEPLYLAACGICHESEHRATVVKNLEELVSKGDHRDPHYWEEIIENGKADALMPAFSKAQGGPLTASQIYSLVEYMSGAFQIKPGPQAKK